MSLDLEIVNADGLPRPRGYSHAVSGAGKLLFIAGQIGCDAAGTVVSDDLVAQFAKALDNVLLALTAGGGAPERIARMTLYVTVKAEYVQKAQAIGAAYRERMGTHYPAMTLVEVKSLLDERAKVEIECTALL